ncbi:hypothetical protein [Mucilaginibacter aquatilis]|uniref:DUF3990 domain-containing protein n=1 Tax=Mucilaginibacter aquatilis TaxID=1517760 RepID=A0A6I4IQ49_9SPHI|nr:hypothetical protein [Mucilaginibacter aquatilis]MVN90494.1 hypothetical protein [Mucilaginibacter aquatilis]
MYDIRPNLVIGFHGCDKSIADKLVANQAVIEKSEKPYDWLGHGMYFWENNLERAWLWAKDKEQRGQIKEASVVGAVLQLGNCLDFLDSKYLSLLSVYYKLMVANFEALKKPIPKNKDVKQDEHKDKLIRELDCALIEFMHEQIFSDYQQEIVANGGYTNVKLFDSTRGVFTEGGEAFPGSAIQMKSHIQICIRNFNSIKGFFLPRDEKDFVTVLKEEYARKAE